MTLNLAVASDGPTRRRLHRHLPPHGIAVHRLSVGGGLHDISELPDAVPIDFDVGFVFPKRRIEGEVLAVALDIPWVNDRMAIETTRNKAGVYARLDRARLPYPRTVHVSSPVEHEDIIDAYETFDGPVVLKPNSTTRGTGHVRIEDRDSLRGATDYLDLIHAFPATDDRSYLIQEYVADARDLRLTVIDGAVAGAVERRFHAEAAGEWVKNVHRGATPVAIDPPDRAVALAEAVATDLDISFLGVDLLLTEDRSLVLEVNGRPTIDRIDQYPSDFYERLASLIERTAAL